MTDERGGLRRPPPPVREAASAELTATDLDGLRRLLWDAFADHEDGGMTEDDWQHALGGRHFTVEVEGALVAHAAVVERELQVDGRPLRTGYVEAVATRPGRQRHGLGTAIMRRVGQYIDATFELGALATGSSGFYARLGWETWRGPTYVRTGDGLRRTADEDGYIMVLRTRSSPLLNLSSQISCDWRPGDVW